MISPSRSRRAQDRSRPPTHIGPRRRRGSYPPEAERLPCAATPCILARPSRRGGDGRGFGEIDRGVQGQPLSSVRARALRSSRSCAARGNAPLSARSRCPDRPRRRDGRKPMLISDLPARSRLRHAPARRKPPRAGLPATSPSRSSPCIRGSPVRSCASNVTARRWNGAPQRHQYTATRSYAASRGVPAIPSAQIAGEAALGDPLARRASFRDGQAEPGISAAVLTSGPPHADKFVSQQPHSQRAHDRSPSRGEPCGSAAKTAS